MKGKLIDCPCCGSPVLKKDLRRNEQEAGKERDTFIRFLAESNICPNDIAMSGSRVGASGCPSGLECSDCWAESVKATSKWP